MGCEYTCVSWDGSVCVSWDGSVRVCRGMGVCVCVVGWGVCRGMGVCVVGWECVSWDGSVCRGMGVCVCRGMGVSKRVYTCRECSCVFVGVQMCCFTCVSACDCDVIRCLCACDQG